MAGGNRRNADAVLAAAIAAGQTNRQAAQMAGVGETLVYRRLREPDFQRLVAQYREEAVARAVGALSSATATAVAELYKLATTAEGESARLGACRSILEFAFKGNEQLNITIRLTELEQLIATKEDKANGQP